MAMAMRIAMINTTTMSSMRVKPSSPVSVASLPRARSFIRASWIRCNMGFLLGSWSCCQPRCRHAERSSRPLLGARGLNFVREPPGCLARSVAEGDLGGEPEARHGTAPRGREDPRMPAVVLRHLAHDRQPEARARERPRPRRTVETLEHVRLIRRIDAWPVVANGERPVVQMHLHLAPRR